LRLDCVILAPDEMACRVQLRTGAEVRVVALAVKWFKYR